MTNDLLGVLYAALGALTFSLNNATARRGVVSGSVLQGMAFTVPVGGLCFLALAAATGQLPALATFPLAAIAWMAGQGIVHFLIGRWFNYHANKLVGLNLSAPVVQLQVVVALLLAVAFFGERFTVLQLLATILMVVGSFVTQSPSLKSKPLEGTAAPVFVPRYLPGYLCGAAAAFAYGCSPLMVQMAFESMPTRAPIASGVIAYAAAASVFGLLSLRRAARDDILSTSRNNAVWFAAAGILVMASQAFVYASLSVAPLMVVTPILQLSLVFRLFLSYLINRQYEVMNAMVIVGAVAAVAGSLLVSIDTDAVLAYANVPAGPAAFLAHRLAGH